MFFIRFLFVAMMSLITLGCVEQRPIERASFLTNVQQLRPVEGQSDYYEYTNPNVNWQRYDKLLIEPVLFKIVPYDTAKFDIRHEELVELGNYFYFEVKEALGNKYPIVYQPGPDVMRVRVAITEAVPVSPIANGIFVATVLMPLDIGSAVLEGEFLDSQTGARLFAFVERKSGSSLNVTEGYTRWAHVKGAMHAWAQDLRQAMDEVHH